MRVKFFGQPDQLVSEWKRKLMSTERGLTPLFRFDANGEYVTDNERLIAKLKTRFDSVAVGEESVPAETVEPVADPEPKLLMKCNKCGFETDNKGLLMAHYRAHKKEGN